MALPTHISDREFEKFEEVGGEVSVRTSAPPGQQIPVNFDYIAFTYVGVGLDGEGQTATATYKSGGSGGTTVATVTFAYNTDDQLASWTRT